MPAISTTRGSLPQVLPFTNVQSVAGLCQGSSAKMQLVIRLCSTIRGSPLHCILHRMLYMLGSLIRQIYVGLSSIKVPYVSKACGTFLGCCLELGV